MHSLLVLVMHDPEQFHEVLSAWCEAGAAGVTVLDSMGTSDSEGHAWCDDLPMLPSLRDVLRRGETPRKLLFSVVPDDIVDSLVNSTADVMGDLSEPGKGLLFAVPITRVLGLREGGRGEETLAGQ